MPERTALLEPLTCVPKRPGPEDCLRIVTSGAPAWSTSCWLSGVKPGCTRPLDVSSYTISAAPLESMVTSKKSARLRLPWIVMQPVPVRQIDP